MPKGGERELPRAEDAKVTADEKLLSSLLVEVYYGQAGADWKKYGTGDPTLWKGGGSWILQTPDNRVVKVVIKVKPRVCPTCLHDLEAENEELRLTIERMTKAHGRDWINIIEDGHHA